MKNLNFSCVIIFLLLPFSQKAQNKIIEDKEYTNDLSIEYTILDNYMDKSQIGFSNVYIFIGKDNIKKNIKSIKNHLRTKKLDRSIFCFLEIPKKFNQDESEKLFLDFIVNILEKRKLVESDLIVFTDKDYTKKYENQRLENLSIQKEKLSSQRNRYNSIYLNEIKFLYVNYDIVQIIKKL